MSGKLFYGELVHLTEEEPETMVKNFTKWIQDTEMARMLSNDPPRLWSEKKVKEWFEKDIEKPREDEVFFGIRSLESDKLIGFIALDGISWQHGDASVAIAIGDRRYWSKGYGTDAMRILQRYAFQSLGLQRLTLVVYDYNPRAQRSYEKSGFVVEGRTREAMEREGRRWDWIYMGILREEWEALNTASSSPSPP